MANPTTKPEQVETDEMAVFADDPQDPASNLTLVKRVEVPRYTSPDAEGRKLSKAERLQLAVNYAVTAEDSAFPMLGVTPDRQDYSMVEGDEFMVLYDLEKPMGYAQFKRNPDVAGVWNPNEQEEI